MWAHWEQLIPDGVHQVLNVNLDVHKNIHGGHVWHHIHGHQAGVAVMHKKFSAQCTSTEIVNTAGSISHFTEDEAVLHACKSATTCVSGGRLNRFTSASLLLSLHQQTAATLNAS